MSRALTENYFEFSNISDFVKIAGLLCDTTTYSSANTGIFFGVDDIIQMQKKYHNSFKNLSWEIITIDDISNNIHKVNFEFSGVTNQGERIDYRGNEFVVCDDQTIYHIEITK